MTRRLSRKSALRLMMVGGGLVAATPAALPQGAIGPSDVDRAKIPCDIFKSKGAKIPCDIVKSKGTQAKIPGSPCGAKNKAGVIGEEGLRNKGQIPSNPCGVRLMNPCELRNKSGVIGEEGLRNKGQIPSNPCSLKIPEAPCLLRNKGGVKK